MVDLIGFGSVFSAQLVWMIIIFVAELVVLLCSLAVELIGGCSHLFSAYKQLVCCCLVL